MQDDANPTETWTNAERFASIFAGIAAGNVIPRIVQAAIRQRPISLFHVAVLAVALIAIPVVYAVRRKRLRSSAGRS